MTLNPEKLGEIKLVIQVENGVVSARLNVENSEVKSIIEQNLQSLKDALSQQNLSAGNLDVSVGSESAREMLERMKASRKHSKGHFGKEEGVIAEETLDFGVDTGRRYGTNSFEFFA
jgi:flagellar hook-length control protein FliK